jgi:hypothetical protein
VSAENRSVADSERFSTRAILGPRNNNIDSINLLKNLVEELKKYKSVYFIGCENEDEVISLAKLSVITNICFGLFNRTVEVLKNNSKYISIGCIIFFIHEINRRHI